MAAAAAPGAATVAATASAAAAAAPHSHPPPPWPPVARQAGPGGGALLRACTATSPVRTRKEVRDLTAAEAAALVAAWRWVIADGSAEALVRVHDATTDDAHWGAQFLPWHRAFVLAMENALRRYDPTVTLPYCTFRWGVAGVSVVSGGGGGD